MAKCKMPAKAVEQKIIIGTLQVGRNIGWAPTKKIMAKCKMPVKAVE